MRNRILNAVLSKCRLRPDPSGRRRCAAVLLAALFAYAFSANLLPSALLRVADDLAVSPRHLALAASLHFGAFFLSATAAGSLAEHLGRRTMFLGASAALALGAVAWASATGFTAACFASVAWGGAGGVFEGFGSALLCGLYPMRRKQLMNASQALYTAGAVLGPVMAGLLLPRGIGWRTLFLGVSALGLLLAGSFAFCRFPSAPAPDAPPAATSHERQVRFNGPFLASCAAMFLYVLSESSVAVYANLYLRVAYGAPENWAIYSIGFFWLAMLTGRTLCTRLPERHDYEHTLIVVLGVGAASLAFQGIAGTWRMSVLGFAFSGFALAGAWPLLVAKVAAGSGACAATRIGILVAIGSLGCVAAPPLMNALFAAVPLRLVFVLAAVPVMLAAVLAGVPFRKTCREDAVPGCAAQPRLTPHS